MAVSISGNMFVAVGVFGGVQFMMYGVGYGHARQVFPDSVSSVLAWPPLAQEAPPQAPWPRRAGASPQAFRPAPRSCRRARRRRRPSKAGVCARPPRRRVPLGRDTSGATWYIEDFAAAVKFGEILRPEQ